MCPRIRQEPLLQALYQGYIQRRGKVCANVSTVRADPQVAETASELYCSLVATTVAQNKTNEWNEWMNE